VPPDEPPFRFGRALQLFPTVVFQHGLAHHEELNRRLEREIGAIRDTHPLWKGRARPWQCAPDLHERPAFRPILDAAAQAIRVANTALHYDVEGFRFTGMWANWLARGEHHPTHTHANNFWSGVYYVRCDAPGTARITFTHPNPAARVLVPRMTELNMANAISWSLDAEPGTLLLFPSWLEHHVVAVAEGERVSLAFNAMLTGDLLEPESLQWSRIG
jgi:uncharacterized protein (TIGR02466 family)